MFTKDYSDSTDADTPVKLNDQRDSLIDKWSRKMKEVDEEGVVNGSDLRSSNSKLTHQASQMATDNKEDEDEGSGPVKAVFFLWGVGVLLPWNVAMNEFDYLNDRVGDNRPAFDYGLAVNGMLTISQLALLFQGHRLSDRAKVQGGFTLAAVLMVAVLAVALTTESDTCFYSCFALLLVFGTLNGMVQGQIFACAGQLPKEYTGMFMTGNGFAGILAGALKIVLLVILKDDLKTQAIVSFAILSAFIVVCALCYSTVFDSAVYKKYTSKADGGHEGGGSLAEFCTNFKKNMSKAGSVLFSMCLVFWVTFVIFPGTFMSAQLQFIVSAFESEPDETKRLNSIASWTNNFVATFFSLFDTIGRYLGSSVNTGKNSTVILTWLRIVFIATTIGTVIPWPPAEIFGQDWFKIVNLLLFSLTNGFLSTRASILAPKMVEADQAGTVGLFNGLMLGLGLNLGTIVALGMRGIKPAEMTS